MSQQNLQRPNRRNFLASAIACVGGAAALHVASCGLAAKTTGARAALAPPVEGEPSSLSWQTVIVSKEEPGTPLVVSGRIYAPDGKTPVEGAKLYVYHTDARGFYSEEDGKGGPPKPRLKGWMQTDREGRYELRTIRPASYPNSRIPQHIHAKVYGAGYAERTIPLFWFDDDPFVTEEMRANNGGQGAFTPIMSVKRGEDGVYRCSRDIKL